MQRRAALVPPHPVFASSFFRWMHAFAAKLFDEKIGMSLYGEPQNHVPLVLPDNRQAVSLRHFEVVFAAEVLMTLKVCTGA